MVLTRDGNGNGAGNAGPKTTSTTVGYADNPLVFKSIALVSTAGATNLAGTVYETGYTSAVTGSASTLAPVTGIVAATTTDFVNLLNVNHAELSPAVQAVMASLAGRLAVRPGAADADVVDVDPEPLSIIDS